MKPVQIITSLNPGFEGVRQATVDGLLLNFQFVEGRCRVTEVEAEAFIKQNQKKVGGKKVYGIVEVEGPAAAEKAEAEKKEAEGGKK